MRDKERRHNIEWQTKRLALVIAGTVPADEKTGKHPLIDFAMNSHLETTEERKAREINEANAEPEVGSFERGMQAMGHLFG